MDLSAFISPVLTIVGGGIMGAIVGYLLSSSKEHTFQLRQKIEDLYINFDNYNEFVHADLLLHIRLYSGEIHMGGLNEIIVEKEENKEYLVRTSMLIDIYFPNLRPDWEAYLFEKEKIRKINSHFEKEYIFNIDLFTKNLEALRVLAISFDSLENISKNTKIKIVQEAKNLVDREALYPKILKLIINRYRLTRSISLN